jgi:hypothetical protein
MFTPLPGRNALGIGPERIIAIIESINAPAVALPELGTEPTKAWLVGCLTPMGRACIVCYFLQTQSNRPVSYVSNPPEVPLETYSALEAESIQYVESMGFMLDNLNFRARSPHEQAQLVEVLPFFRDQHPRSATTTTAPGVGGPQPAASTSTHVPERAALARFLAQF